MIRLGQVLGLEVVAEGVETAEELYISKQLGCDIIQGYIYSKPLAEKDFTRRLVYFIDPD